MSLLSIGGGIFDLPRLSFQVPLNGLSAANKLSDITKITADILKDASFPSSKNRAHSSTPFLRSKTFSGLLSGPALIDLSQNFCGPIDASATRRLLLVLVCQDRSAAKIETAIKITRLQESFMTAVLVSLWFRHNDIDWQAVADHV